MRGFFSEDTICASKIFICSTNEGSSELMNHYFVDSEDHPPFLVT